VSKLPNKEFASSFQRNVEPSGTVVSDDGVVAGEDGCLLFERDDVGEDSLVVGGRAATMDSFTADSASSRIVGWSTLLAVMFVFWGTSAGGPTDMSLTEGVSPTSMAGVQVQPTEFVSAGAKRTGQLPAVF